MTRHDPKHPVPRTWHDAYIETQQFQALLRKYHNDYQKAVSAWMRGEVGDPHESGGSANPM
jgi:hypothetical protein